MSRLDELIAKLCPDGVEYRYILEVADVLYGYPCDATKFNDVEIGIPLARIRNVLEGTTTTYTTEEIPKQYNLQYGDLLVGMDGNFHVGNWRMDSGILCQRVCKFWSKDENAIILNRFLSHLLPPIMKKIENSKQSGTVKHLLAKDIKMIKLPVPPLEVQREIVHILDSFTLLTAELTAELTARKKQYEFYKDELLSVKKNIPIVKLGDVATEFYRGSGIKRDEVTDTGIPCVRYGEIYTTYNTWFDKCVSYTKLDFVKSPKYFENGDILFAITGESVEDIAKSVAYIGHEKCLAGGDIVVMKHNQNPRYLAHVLATTEARMQKSKGKVKSKVVHSNVPSIKEIQIPLPSLEIQEKYANVLDNFEAICTDLNIGLPAEIEARQKQYEYYRDLLLTFAETGNMLATDRQTDRAERN